MSFENLPPTLIHGDALPLGLGCSRLGSVNGADGDEARQLVKLALDQGFRFFDTSNIYGQGDSERILGDVLRNRDDVVVCSKAGKYLSAKMRVLAPLKGVLRKVARRSDRARRAVGAARARPMPARWDPAFLCASLEGSLRRLKRERIEMFMLHSPPVEVVSKGDAIRALEQARQAGKISIIGVSVDDVETAQAALKDSRVKALQIPLHPSKATYDAVVRDAVRQGVAIIAREILGGVNAVASQTNPDQYAREQIITSVRRAGISLSLVGATRKASLIASAEAARATMAAEQPR